MRSIVSLITASALLLHMWLGCCAHHAHAAEERPCALHSGSEAAVGHDHCHGHEHPAPRSDSPHHPGGPSDDCHESHCTFLVAGKTIVVLDSLISPLPELAIDAHVAQAASSSIHSICETDDHLRPPVRLHLYYQVLLI